MNAHPRRPLAALRLGRAGLACLAVSSLFCAAPCVAQTLQPEDAAQRRSHLQQAQAQLREDIRQKTEILYSVSVAQSLDDASYRRQQADLISLRTQDGEVQRQLIKAELKVIEADIKVQVCPEAAPDKRVVEAELKIAEAQRRYLSDRADAIRRSIELAVDRFKSRTADLDSRRDEIEQLQAKEQRVTAELNRLTTAPRASAAVATQ